MFKSSFIAAVGWMFSMLAACGMELTAPPTVAVSTSNAVIEWHTDVACGTRAQVNPDSAKVTVPDKTTGRDHRVIVSGLQPGVTYHVTMGSARVWLATNTFTLTGTAAGTPKVTTIKPASSQPASNPPPTRKIWGNPASLPDHYARHGADFHARNADDYARMSWEFLQRARTEGLPAKVDADGVLRVFDPATGAFASYNPDGTTKTFFKPGSPDYFERQPGKSVNLKTSK